jgi:CheY-like chemotaxis protein
MSLPTLLLVDDAPEIGFLVQRLVRKAGHEVVVCHSVPSALERLQTLRPDLILLDLNLPGLSGLELCAQLRQQTEHREMPIALFGSEARTDDLAAALEAGVDFLLDKDLLARPDACLARLGEILQMAGSRMESHLLEYSDSHMSLSPSTDGIIAFNKALRHIAVLQRGTRVVRVLLRRVLVRLWESVPGEGDPTVGDASGTVAEWLSPDGLGLAPTAFPSAHRASTVAACAIALSDQFARVWGLAARQAAREALLTWIPS